MENLRLSPAGPGSESSGVLRVVQSDVAYGVSFPVLHFEATLCPKMILRDASGLRGAPRMVKALTLPCFSQDALARLGQRPQNPLRGKSPQERASASSIQQSIKTKNKKKLTAPYILMFDDILDQCSWQSGFREHKVQLEGCVSSLSLQSGGKATTVRHG